MIVNMKKIHLLMELKDVQRSLEALRALGVVHIEHLKEPKGEDLAEIQKRYTQVEKALSAIEKYSTKNIVQQSVDGVEISSVIVKGVVEKQEAQEKMINLSLLIEQWSLWGDFDPKDIAILKEKGLFVYFFEGDEKEILTLPKNIVIESIKRCGKKVYAFVVSNKAIDLASLTTALPVSSLEQMKEDVKKLKQSILKQEQQLAKFIIYQDSLRKALDVLLQQLTFEQARQGMGQENKISLLKGFCPQDQMEALNAEVKRQGWGILIEDPLKEDIVPTLIKNPAWVRMITPVFDFMSILPGYREADVSACFLIFFSIFFGILIGDAGYGFIFLAVTFVAHKKSSKQVDKAVFYLMYVLSTCAILWGLATGTVFGTSLFGNFIKPLVPWLTKDVNLKEVCFMIGVTHLTIAHIWRGLRKLPSLSAIGDVGWLLLLWSAYFFCGQIILERAVPFFVMPMVWSGVGIVLLFNRPEKNILVTVLNGVGDLLLNIMNVFIDLISYIRLFAVAAASVALANSFNAAVSSIGFDHVLAGLGTALILVMGHAFNIILSLMAVLVHGIRLNILEFSGHQGLEWLGIKYEPLKKV